MNKTAIVLSICLFVLTGLSFTQQGYVVAGYTYSYTHSPGLSDILIYKLDANGRKQWRRNLEEVGDEEAYTIQQTTDGGYVVGGISGDPYHAFILKLDNMGLKQWSKRLEDTGAARSIQQTTDGGYSSGRYEAVL